MKVAPVFDDLAATFYNNVVAAYDEYAGHRDSSAAGRDRHLRTAVAAATALYHFREHLPDKLRAPVTKLEQTSLDYALLKGVSNASKHKQVTRGQPLVAGADHIRELTVIVLYTDQEGDYPHSQTKIEVTCTDETVRSLDPAIVCVLNFWGALLTNAGVCSYNARLKPEAPGCRYPSRDEASTSMSLDAMKGLDFRQSMQLLRFDNDLGCAIPVNLTGADLWFRIFRPPQQIVDVRMWHPDHGEVTASIPLTDEENIALLHVQSQAEHEAFMEAAFNAHRFEIEQNLQQQFVSEMSGDHPFPSSSAKMRRRG